MKIVRSRPLPGDPLALAVPHRDGRDRGSVIDSLDSNRLIAEVELEAGTAWPDDRGSFSELFRLGGEGVGRGFFPRSQISAAVTYPGVIKAVHYHRRQSEIWAPLQGGFQVMLVDLRIQSETFGRVNTLFLGSARAWRVRIPPGVGHGYRILGAQAGLLIYATDHFYDVSDEGRIPYDDAGLNYAWETINR